jgi:peptidoglycan/LPS O-acetylase OafA/YrhL
MINNFLTDQSTIDLLLYSGKGPNDLGLYANCHSANGTHYVVIKIASLPLLVSFGICGPKECETHDYLILAEPIAKFANDSFHQVNTNFDVQVSDVEVYDPSIRPPLKWPFYVSISIFAIFIVLGIVGRLASKRISYNGKFWKCFDISHNFYDVLNAPNRDSQNLVMFDGIRTLGMCWVMLGHIFYVYLHSPVTNPTWINGLLYSYSQSFISNATCAVDVFFCLSGFLLSYVLMKKIKGMKGKFPAVKMIIHRLIRLYPLFVIVFILYAGIVPALGSGPVFKVYDDEIATCPSTWWYVFTFILNFKPDVHCYLWTWYLSDDMQFFIASLIIIYAFSRNRKMGYLILALVFTGCCVGSIFVAYHFNLSNSFVKYNSKYYKYYYSPYVRAPAYLIGLLSGMLYYQWKEKEAFQNLIERITSNRLIRNLISFLGLGCVYFTVQLLYWIDNNDKASALACTFQFSLSRPLFSLGLVLFMFPTIIGKGSFLRAVFDNYFWRMSAKLTYAAYLLHLVVMKFSLYSLTYGINYSLVGALESFWGYALVVFLLSIIMTAVFEEPIVMLEMAYIFPVQKRETKEADQTPLKVKDNI